MAEPAPAKPLADLLHKGDTVMLMTMIGDEHSSRPMTVADVQGSEFACLADTTADWYDAVATGEAIVHVTLSDVRRNNFAALNGTASTTGDRSEIERLWNPAASAFFDGKDDPKLAVLRFVVSDGQYWDSPSGRLGSMIAIVRAAVGGHGAAGDHGPVATD